MSTRPVFVAISVVAAAAVVVLLVAQVEWPGSLAGCVETGTCDCETVGGDGIRQPINALSSLGLVAVGSMILLQTKRASLRLFGAAVVAAGAASFLSHAAVRDWSHTLDSLGVKAVVLFAVIFPVARSRPVWAPFTVALAVVWALELAWPATTRPLLVVLVVAAVIANLGPRLPRRALQLATATLLIATVAWWLGRSASPLCDPSSILQPHALWHLLVAGAMGALYQHYQEVSNEV